MRIGHGYDVHAFATGRDLIIGGIKIPYCKGLLGHSDADVLLHAISDALLGAVALGDIGSHFPDSDPQWKNANSLMLLEQVVKMLNKQSYKIVNIDATIIAQSPEMKPYIEQMRFNISTACKIQIGDINVKATTEEHLGFTGREEGIAAHAVCLLDT